MLTQPDRMIRKAGRQGLWMARICEYALAVLD